MIICYSGSASDMQTDMCLCCLHIQMVLMIGLTCNSNMVSMKCMHYMCMYMYALIRAKNESV